MKKIILLTVAGSGWLNKKNGGVRTLTMVGGWSRTQVEVGPVHRWRLGGIYHLQNKSKMGG